MPPAIAAANLHCRETDGGKVKERGEGAARDGGRGRERTIEVGEEKMKVKDEARCPIKLLMHACR